MQKEKRQPLRLALTSSNEVFYFFKQRFRPEDLFELSFKLVDPSFHLGLTSNEFSKPWDEVIHFRRLIFLQRSCRNRRPSCGTRRCSENVENTRSCFVSSRPDSTLLHYSDEKFPLNKLVCVTLAANLPALINQAQNDVLIEGTIRITFTLFNKCTCKSDFFLGGWPGATSTVMFFSRSFFLRSGLLRFLLHRNGVLFTGLLYLREENFRLHQRLADHSSLKFEDLELCLFPRFLYI